MQQFTQKLKDGEMQILEVPLPVSQKKLNLVIISIPSLGTLKEV